MTSPWKWIKGQIRLRDQINTLLGAALLSLASTIWAATSDLAPKEATSVDWLVFFVLFTAALLVLVGLAGWARRIWSPRGPIDAPPHEAKDEASPLISLASFHWREGNQGNATNPWTASVTIDFIRGAENVSLRARVGEWNLMLGGTWHWVWSDQIQMFDPQDVAKGHIVSFTVAEVPVGESEVEIFEKKYGGRQNHVAKICVELIVGSAAESQKETRIYGLPAKEKFEPVLIGETIFQEDEKA